MNSDMENQQPVVSTIAALKILSPREIEVLDLTEQGYTNQENAERLSLSVETIKTHKKNMRKRLGVKGITSPEKWLWLAKNPNKSYNNNPETGIEYRNSGMGSH